MLHGGEHFRTGSRHSSCARIRGSADIFLRLAVLSLQVALAAVAVSMGEARAGLSGDEKVLRAVSRHQEVWGVVFLPRRETWVFASRWQPTVLQGLSPGVCASARYNGLAMLWSMQYLVMCGL